ncbi:Crp/Fnr family transcriptional regulator [Flagellimonas sp.]|uniref:Crp/Fnr family transcriptional regulator n=1 Tax=Flagellimonas sp. TaxID=2058762 RepID=UPI0034B6A073
MGLDAFFNYLSKYVSLSHDEKELLKPFLQHKIYLKGQYIVQQGNICLYDNFVVKGCVRTFHLDKQGQEHIIRFAIESWWAADMGSFLKQAPADYNVQCLEKTEVLQFTHPSLQEMFGLVPKFERFFRKIIQNAFVASEKRIALNFSLDAKERYLIFSQLYPQLERRVPQYMIASYLGISKQYLSELKSHLARE